MTANLALSLWMWVWAVHCWSPLENFPVFATTDGMEIVLGVLVMVVIASLVGFAVKYQAVVQPHKIPTAIFIVFKVLGFL